MRMLPTVLRNFFGRSAVRLYPYEAREPFSRARQGLYNNISECIFCSMCARKCPSDCITVDKDAGLWTHDPAACVYCGDCVDACPTNCLAQETTHLPPLTELTITERKGTPPKKKSRAQE